MDETKKTAVMKTNLKFKPKAGYVYVVTSEYLRERGGCPPGVKSEGK